MPVYATQQMRETNFVECKRTVHGANIGILPILAAFLPAKTGKNKKIGEIFTKNLTKPMQMDII